MQTIDVGNPLAHSERFHAWLREHGLDPNVVFKVEIADGDVIAYCYELNEHGKKFVRSGEVAIAPPIRVEMQRSWRRA